MVVLIKPLNKVLTVFGDINRVFFFLISKFMEQRMNYFKSFPKCNENKLNLHFNFHFADLVEMFVGRLVSYLSQFWFRSLSQKAADCDIGVHLIFQYFLIL